MSKVKEIQSAIESLSEDEYASLRRWFSERDWEKWDRQIEADLVRTFINTLTYIMLDSHYLLWHDDNRGGYPCQEKVHITSF